MEASKGEMEGFSMKAQQSWKQNLRDGIMMALKIWVPVALLLFLAGFLFRWAPLRSVTTYVQSFVVIEIFSTTWVIVRQR